MFEHQTRTGELLKKPEELERKCDESMANQELVTTVYVAKKVEVLELEDF